MFIPTLPSFHLLHGIPNLVRLANSAFAPSAGLAGPASAGPTKSNQIKAKKFFFPLAAFAPGA